VADIHLSHTQFDPTHLLPDHSAGPQSLESQRLSRWARGWGPGMVVVMPDTWSWDGMWPPLPFITVNGIPVSEVGLPVTIPITAFLTGYHYH